MLPLPESHHELQELRFVLDQAAYTAVLDERGRFLDVNERLERVAGYHRRELRGRSFQGLLAEELPFLVRQHLRSQLTRHGSWSGELCFRSRNGRNFWAEVRLVRMPGNSSRYHCLAFDVTERKAVEHSLSRNQSFARTLMESAPVGIFLADADGVCTYVNQRWTEVAGLRLRTAILPGWEMAVHPDDREHVAEAWRDFVNGGPEFREEFRYVAAGKVRHVLASAIRLETHPGPRSRFLRVEQDLTDLKNTERLVDEQRAKMLATSKIAALGEMAGGIAHEINNPLAIIHGNAELLKFWVENGQPIEATRLRELSETFSATSLRISKIIKALRAIARNAEHDPVEPTLLAPLIEYVVSLSTARARDERIAVTVSPIPAGLSIACRPAQVSQILLNLLNNAFHACLAGERWVKVDVRDGGSAIEIAVADGGPGIDSGLRDKLFQPFFTTKPVGTGMGLGLSVSRGLAASHGGRLYLDPDAPHTRFVLSLPKRSPSSSKGRP